MSMAATSMLALFSAYLGKMLATSSRREQEESASAGALAEEVPSVRTVFALGRHEIKKYTRKLSKGKKMAQGKYLRLSIICSASMFVLHATYGLALWVATSLLSQDLMTPGGATTVIMAVMMGCRR
jgi:Flp pilus assembly protein TadB